MENIGGFEGYGFEGFKRLRGCSVRRPERVAGTQEYVCWPSPSSHRKLAERFLGAASDTWDAAMWSLQHGGCSQGRTTRSLKRLASPQKHLLKTLNPT